MLAIRDNKARRAKGCSPERFETQWVRKVCSPLVAIYIKKSLLIFYKKYDIIYIVSEGSPLIVHNGIVHREAIAGPVPALRPVGYHYIWRYRLKARTQALQACNLGFKSQYRHQTPQAKGV